MQLRKPIPTHPFRRCHRTCNEVTRSP
jgi:hypothetical protein